MNKFKDSHHTMGLGIPTMLLLFVVLGMVILSMLAYLKEENNYKIVEREIEYTKNYYKADSKAQYVLKNKNENDIKELCEEYSLDSDLLEFIIKVDEKHYLNVVEDNDKIVKYQLKIREK